MGKKKKKKSKVPKVKVKRTRAKEKKERIRKTPFKIIVHDPHMPHLDKEIEGASVIRVKTKKKRYLISYNEKNDAIQIKCRDNTTYVQPISTAEILIK